MDEWDGLKAIERLNTDHLVGGSAFRESDPRSLFQALHSNLFAALFCCRESRNHSALVIADRAAKKATALVRWLAAALPREARPFGYQEGAEFFPRPWWASWFRALSKASLGLRSEALIYYRQAYRDLVNLIEEELKAAHPGEPTPDRNKEQKPLDISPDPAFFILAAYRQPVIARFFHDLGMFLFEEGDWGYDPVTGKGSPLGAETFLELAGMLADPKRQAYLLPNPYVRAGRALFYSFSRREGEALKEIHDAFCTLEEERRRWQSKGRSGDFYATGRVHFQAGLLAYKYLRGLIGQTEGPRCGEPDMKRINALKKAIADIKKHPREDTASLMACFDTRRKRAALSATRGLFATACRYYLRIKNPFKALSALILMADPLDIVTGDDNKAREAAAKLIWEFAYGMGGDFTSNLIGYENLVKERFAPSHSDEE
jgi:hypothetical protein